MNVIFAYIEYQHKPVIRDYNPDTDEVICDFALLEINQKAEYLPKKLFNYLKSTTCPFITLQKDKAIIDKIGGTYA